MAREFAVTTGTVGFPLILIVLGVSTYFIYRGLIYNPVILYLQTKYVTNRHRLNYRQYLMKEYEINFIQAGQLFSQISELYFSEKYSPKIRTMASGIHLTYLVSLTTIPYIIFSIYRHDLAKIFVFISICLIAFVSAFLLDASYEEWECNMMISNSTQIQRNVIANKLGFMRR